MKYVLSIVVDNHANVMARVSSLFARRRFNMSSVTAARTSDPNISIITIVTSSARKTIKALRSLKVTKHKT